MTKAHRAATWPKQTAVGEGREVASASTLRRLEKWANKATAWRLHEVFGWAGGMQCNAARRPLMLQIVRPQMGYWLFPPPQGLVAGLDRPGVATSCHDPGSLSDVARRSAKIGPSEDSFCRICRPIAFAQQ